MLGVTYKADVNDVRESPALEIIEMLSHKGAAVSYADPFIPQVAVGDLKLTGVEATPDSLASADCVLLLSNHACFDGKVIADNSRLVVDTRNALKAHRHSRSTIVTL